MSLEANSFAKKGDETSKHRVHGDDDHGEAIYNQECCGLRALIVQADGVLGAFDLVKSFWYVSEFLSLVAEARNVALAVTMVGQIARKSLTGAILNKGQVQYVAGVILEHLTTLLAE